MKTRNTWAVVLMLGAIVMTGCGTVTEVQLGAVLSLQGRASSYGQAIQRGIEVAVDKVNAEGGVGIADSGTRVPLSVLVRDAQSDPQIGLQVARELIDMGHTAVIGSDDSAVTLAIADLFQRSEVVLISPSSSTPALRGKGSYIYRNYPSDEFEAVSIASYIYNVAGTDEVHVISSQSEYGLGIKNAFIARFRALGGDAEIQVSFPAEEPDVGARLEDLAATKAGGIYIAGYSDETAAIARMLRDAGIDLPLFGTGAILPDELVAAGGDAVEGLVFPTVMFDAEEEPTADFIAAYRNKFGSDPDIYAAHGYDAVLIIVQAIEQEGLSSDNISFYMNAMNPFAGAAGSTKFDQDGNAQKFHRMWVIDNGQARALEGIASGGSQ
ncbi:MAG: penicillin-binding protein activator [Acidobacteria bacterium]|nr:penicillin-binding protein activator [Acidobacteriota bacterium]